MLNPAMHGQRRRPRRRSTPAPSQSSFWKALFVVYFSCITTEAIDSTEKEILQEFYQTTNGDSWKNKDGWNSEEVSVCSWHGIGCTADGKVQSVTLDRNNLNGSVPPSFWRLQSLQHVNLRMNLVTSLSLSGLFTSDPQNDPRSPLENLMVAENHLTGLDGIVNAVDTLKDLNANKNRIDKPVLDDFVLMVNLQTLYVAFNQIPGTIPTHIGRLGELSGLYAFDNRITGTIPSEIGMLNQLQILGLGNNLLTGTLATEMEQMVNIRDLSLHQVVNEEAENSERHTGLTGPLLTFGDMPFISLLFLDGNSLTGSIPADFLRHNTHIDTQVSIGLTGNMLTGTVPKSLERFEAFSIDLEGNNITGIPEELCEKGGWMGGLVEEFKCDAILCPPGTFNDLGRVSGEENPCKACNDPVANSTWFGATSCNQPGPEDDSSDEIDLDVDWAALAKLYASTRGIHWANQDGWQIFAAFARGDETLKDLARIGFNFCDEWFGVICDSTGRIIEVSLPDNRLFGEVPGDFFSISTLQTVDLSNNNVKLSSLQPINKATALTVLNLSNVRVESTVGLGELTSLWELRLDGQTLDERLPEGLFHLTSLQVLHLQHGKFFGQIPSSMGQLTELVDLNMYGNLLSGQLPLELNSLTKLSTLDLSENQFSGYFPDIASLSKLETLIIHQSEGVRNVGGPLPPFDTFPLLREVNMEFNALTGSIPESFLAGITNRTSAITISLGYNQLEGDIPELLGRFEKLNLGLEGNKIIGIPESLCIKDGWMDGVVGTIRNSTSGCDAILCPPRTWNAFGKASELDPCIPCDVGSSQNIWDSWYGRVSCGDITPSHEKEILDKLFIATGGRYWTAIHDNWLRPGVPICQREGVECIDPAANDGVLELRLNRYGLRGTVPSDIWDLPHARQLAFTNNEIDIRFDGIENAEALKVLKLSNCKLRGIEGIQNASGRLMELHLARNQFNGTVPSEIFLLSQVSQLYLAGNNFDGMIPTDFTSLEKLSVLDLSDNHFIGSISPAFAVLKELRSFELQLNELSGSVPETLQALQKLQYLDISQQGGAGLGGPVPVFDRCPELVHLDLSHNGFSGPLPGNLLASSDPGAEIFIDLASNRLEGDIPEEWERFQALTIELGGNRLSALPAKLCDMNEWQKGLVGLMQTCDTILCPPGTAAPSGRQAGAMDSCLPCSAGETSAPFYGSNACLDPRFVREKQILIDFYEATNGTNWLVQTGWLSDTPFCDWYGVVCDEQQHVTEIKLDTNMMRGSAFEASNILTLEDLKVLDLKGNDVQLNLGKVSLETKLEYLGLSGTELKTLTGISRATSLRAFHATNNNIQSIPNELFSLSRLESLFLSYNSVKGTISRNFEKLSGLKELYLFGNQLTGTIPAELTSLANMTELILARNFLSGRLPTGFSSLSQLEQLIIYDQQGPELITGPVPSFSHAPNLVLFDASNNDLAGAIPDNFLAGSATDKLISINLRNNAITGTIPIELRRFDELDINLADNKILAIPVELCGISGWMGGRIGEVESCSAILCPRGSFNQFGHESPSNPCEPCGQLSASPYMGHTHCEDFTSERETLNKIFEATGGEFWSNASKWQSEAPICSWEGIACEDGDLQDADGITSIQLDRNGLSGTIPSDIWTLPSLRTLSLENNPGLVINFNGLSAAKSLEILRISQTNVNSLDGIAAARGLKEAHLSGIGIQSIFPDDIIALSSTIEYLNISENRFFGVIPSTIGKLTNLRSFSAQNNDFLSTIPSEIGNLKYLSSLDLAENVIYGSVPTELSAMPSLETLSLYRKKKSGPRLSGYLPSLDGLPQLKHLNLNGNDVEGSIPSNFLSSSRNIEAVYLSSNALTGSVPDALSDLPGLHLELTGNKIAELPERICDKSGWMDGKVAEYGCEAVLCKPGTSSPLGRMDNLTTSCMECANVEAAPFYGSTSCDNVLSEREILLNLFYALEGRSWYRSDFWGSTADICDWFGVGCSHGHVVILNLHGNNLHGVPGQDIFSLSELRILWLYSNPIEFSFENIGNAKKLQDLRLDSTNLHSLRGIGKAQSLVSFDAGFSAIRGTLPQEILSLTNLRTLHLNNNFISGLIPTSFASVEFLSRLRIDSNQLTGDLPSFSDMPFLEFIDLSNNFLEGPIRRNFLENLRDDANPTLRLSNNQITGVVPPEFDRFSEMTLHLSQNRLLGLPVILCDNSRWNGGDVAKFGCDAILCPPETANDIGRKTTDRECQPCTTATYFGDTSCRDQRPSAGSIPGIPSTLHPLYILGLGVVLAYFAI